MVAAARMPLFSSSAVGTAALYIPNVRNTETETIASARWIYISTLSRLVKHFVLQVVGSLKRHEASSERRLVRRRTRRLRMDMNFTRFGLIERECRDCSRLGNCIVAQTI